MEALSFKMAADAAEWLKYELAHQPMGMEPALITQLGFETRNRRGKLLERYQGEHFGIGYYHAGDRPQALHIELFGHMVSVVSETLERLRGRTLTIR
jgi:hypothetical protein